MRRVLNAAMLAVWLTFAVSGWGMDLERDTTLHQVIGSNETVAGDQAQPIIRKAGSIFGPADAQAGISPDEAKAYMSEAMAQETPAPTPTPTIAPPKEESGLNKTVLLITALLTSIGNFAVRALAKYKGYIKQPWLGLIQVVIGILGGALVGGPIVGDSTAVEGAIDGAGTAILTLIHGQAKPAPTSEKAVEAAKAAEKVEKTA